MIEANLLFDQGAAGAALEIWEALYANAQEPILAAGLAVNIGNCYLERRTPAVAITYFERAVKLFEQVGVTTEVVRVRWCIACVALAAGDLQRAVRELRAVKRQFEGLEMLYEAALVIPDLKDALTTVGETQSSRGDKNARTRLTGGNDTFCSSAAGARRGSSSVRRMDRRKTADAERLERLVEMYLRACFRGRTVARISELAALAGTSREHVSRLALRVYGRPLSAEFRERQLAEAERLLRTSSLKVGEVAAASAFGHASTFRRLFRQKFAVSPSAYRRKIT